MKAKRSTRKRTTKQLDTSREDFMSVWVGGQTLALFVAIAIISVLSGLPLAWESVPFLGLAGIFGLVLGALVSTSQHVAIRMSFGEWFEGWWRVGVMGWTLGMVAVLGTASLTQGMSDTIANALQAMILVGTPAVLQWTVLRRYVDQAWVWVLASFTGSNLFSFPISNLPGLAGAVVAIATYALVTGIIMLWLYLSTAPPVARKINASDDTRLQQASDHLQASDDDTASDHQTASDQSVMRDR